jgi:cysteine synthase A
LFAQPQGTLAGVSRFLKRKSRGAVHVVLADPQGSGLFNKVKHGVVYSHTEAEGTRRRHQTDTVVEGIGLNRLTHNFAHALPATDDAERVLDQEAVAMSRWLVQECVPPSPFPSFLCAPYDPPS